MRHVIEELGEWERVGQAWSAKRLAGSSAQKNIGWFAESEDGERIRFGEIGWVAESSAFIPLLLP